MTTKLPPTPVTHHAPRVSRGDVARVSGIPWPVAAVLVAATLIVVGVIWDISWHMSIGRDTLFSPPHLATYAAAAIVGVTCGWLALHTTFRGTAEERARTVGYWGFRAPLGAWICVWGAIAMLTSAPFDDWWHNAYGLDVKILSPPHVLLAFGMYAIVVGALVMTLAARSAARDPRARMRLELAFVFALGLMLTMVSVITAEHSERARQHGSQFYVVSALAYPVLLAAASRASTLRWPATSVALVYTLARMLQGWILPLFPAEPRLGPILYPVTHMAAMEFPLLLVAPAIAFDVVVRRSGASMSRARELGLAAVLGVLFVAFFVAAQWPFASFLHTPAARNWFFFADRNFVFWGRATSPYRRYAFYDLGESRLQMLRGFAWAVALAAVSAWVGLSRGRWMRSVRR